MAELSKEAQAVLDAAFTLADNLDRDVTEAEMIAAALRAAADQVVPEFTTPWNSTFTHMISARGIRAKFLAIAAELRGQQ